MTLPTARRSLETAVRSICTGVAASAVASPDLELWEFACRSGLGSLLAAALDPPNAGAPEMVRAVIRQAGMMHLRTLVDLRELGGALDAAGVRWLVFKGPVLSDVIYPRPGLRVYGDLDLLVHPHDVEPAIECLLHAGSTLLDRNWEHIRRTQQSEISLVSRHGTMLDLHWHVVSNPRTRKALGLNITTMLDHAVRVEVGNVDVPTLDPIDTICHLCLHAALSGGHQLRWLVDIQLAIRWADPDPVALRRRASELGCLLVTQVMMQRVVTHLDPDLRALLDRLGPQGPWGRLCALLDRWLTLDPETDAYSGRAVFSSTRAGTRHSVLAAAGALRRAASSGKTRRSQVPNAAVLHRDGGTVADRAAWLDMARTHA